MSLRLGPKGEEVLLRVKVRPFLSHKRENARTVARLKEELKLYGAGGWKDTDDLGIGTSAREGLRAAILKQTGGFVWWGTKKALGSETINALEIPTALERAAVEPRYPIVPVFVDVRPGAAKEKLNPWIGRESSSRFVDRNGLLRANGESLNDLCRRVARRYVRDAVGGLKDVGASDAEGAAVAFRALSEPGGDHALTFDWRAAIGERSRRLEAGVVPVLLDALANTRESLQARAGSPTLSLDLDLPLPLAFLVGYEWRITTRLRLRVLQRTGPTLWWAEHAGPLAEAPEPRRVRLEGSGPALVSVSCGGAPLEPAARAYAEEIGASALTLLHVPGMLDNRRIRALARTTASQLRVLNDCGMRKHLLMRGPIALAVMCGAESNATGPTTLPFWDGSRYVSPLEVGVLQAC